MMLEHTPAVRRALEAAHQWARRCADGAVEPVHLLLGLVDEEEGRAATLLVRGGLDLLGARRALAGRPGQPAGTPDGPALTLSLPSQQVLEHASRVTARNAVEGSLTSEQVLVALLRHDTAVRQELEALGLSWARLEAEAVSLNPPLHLDEPLELEEPIQFQGTSAQMDAARILDANANRAREAVRVVEDYCRFVLDDAFLSGELKRLRHELTAVLVQLDVGRICLAARETQRDVGTNLTTNREGQRQSLEEVALVNLKRLEEALRCLEEYAKLSGPAPAQALKQLRYRAYTLERTIHLAREARQRLEHARLYLLVTGSLCTAALDWTIAEAVAGGVQVVQLREKELSDRALLERAGQVRQWTRDAGALFIMNDRPDIARLVEADGVHLGQDELPVKEARRIVGPEMLVGVSTHNIEQLRRAIDDGASYVGLGPTFSSGTKGFEELAGLDFVRAAAAETSLPAFAIGGINADNVAAALAAGARRVAVCQAICQADDPRRAAAAIRRMLDQASRACGSDSEQGR